MAFGPESTNPRERRAYADALLARPVEDGTQGGRLLEAVIAAKATRKGYNSRYIERFVARSAMVVTGSNRSVTGEKDIREELTGVVVSIADAKAFARWAKSADNSIPEPPVLDQEVITFATTYQKDSGLHEVDFTDPVLIGINPLQFPNVEWVAKYID